MFTKSISRLVWLFVLSGFVFPFGLTFAQGVTSYNRFDAEQTWVSGQDTGFGIVIGDFNGDGMADKAYKFFNGQWYVGTSTDHSFNLQTLWGVAGNGAAKVYCGDFNGDGISDMASYYQSLGGIQFVWRMALSNGASFDGEQTWIAGQDTGLGILIGDFNGDGMADKAYKFTNGQWYVGLSNGFGFNFQTYWGVAGNGATKAYIGDFNGDGNADLGFYYQSYGGSQNVWRVALSSGKLFKTETTWITGQDTGLGIVIGDFNGDRKSDKAYRFTNGQWYVGLSSGTSFNLQRLWGTIGNGAAKVYTGDFNNDGFCDMTSYYASRNGSQHVWTIAPSSVKVTPIVATWQTILSSSTTDGQGAMWGAIGYDHNRTPVAGWGTNKTITGRYISTNTAVISRQIDAMCSTGINLVILDRTNGYLYNYSDPSHAAREKSAADSFFSVMSKRPPNKRIQIAIAAGGEFETDITYGLMSPAAERDSLIVYQNAVLDSINRGYVTKYPGLYFRFRNRPLVLAYIADPVNYNANRNYSNVPWSQRVWNRKDFTVVPVFGSNRADGVNWYNNSNPRRFWFFNNEATHPTPYDNVCMNATVQSSYGILSYYPDSSFYNYQWCWSRILDKRPIVTMLSSWNNWGEDMSMEGCVGANGYKDRNNNSTYDWFLQMTRDYVSILKYNALPSGAFVWERGRPLQRYAYNGTLTAQSSTVWPARKADIMLPQGWLVSHRYLANYKIGKENAVNSNLVSVKPSYAIDGRILRYAVPANCHVKAVLYDVAGKSAKVLLDRNLEAGSYAVTMKDQKVGNGIYFLKLSIGANSFSEKLVLCK